MAEDRNRFLKAFDVIRGREEKANYNQMFGNDVSVYGYNTTSGFFESDKLAEIGDGSANSAVIACINVLNILPRVVKGRNDIITDLNKHIESFCRSNDLVNFMNTESLFCSRYGKRKNQYFVPASRKIADTCHLNRDGVERLGKYLKYWTHRHITTR